MRTIRTFLVAAILVAAIAGGALATGSQESGASSDGPLVITMRPWTANGATLSPNTPTELWLEDYFNVQLEPWYGVDGYDTESANVRFASGDVPDYLGSFNPDYVSLGIAKELPTELIRENMPGYMAQADRYLGDEVWRRTTIEGTNYAVPTALSMASTGMVLGYRVDWMRAVGYEPEPVPGRDFYAGPDTLEEVEELLLAFHEDDPDGDGADNTYGWVAWKINTNFDSNVFPTVFGAFGVQLDTWDVRDGEPYYSMADPNYRDALKYLNRWYDMGIIHPEVVTSVRSDVQRMFATAEVGAWSGLDAWMSNYAAGPWGSYLEAVPDGEIAVSVTPAGPNGQRGSWYRDPNWTPWAIGARASDEVTVKIMEIVETFYTDANLYAIEYHGGPEGEAWEWDDQGYARPIEGAGSSSRDAIDATAVFGARMFNGWIAHIVPPIDKVYIPPNRHQLQSYLEESQVFGPGYGFRPTFSEDERAKLKNINTIVQEFAWGGLTGSIGIDAEWDSYLRELNNAGLDELLETVASQQ